MLYIAVLNAPGSFKTGDLPAREALDLEAFTPPVIKEEVYSGLW